MTTKYSNTLYEVFDPRAGELFDWQLTTGRPLPMPITAILAHEDAGLVVDLVTGEVTPPDMLVWPPAWWLGWTDGTWSGVVLDLTPDHACIKCGAMPHVGLWVSCWGCHLPVCERCAHQTHGGHFCAGCGSAGGAP